MLRNACQDDPSASDGMTGTSWAMAHMHPASSRALATVTTWACGPRATRCRSRVPSLTWAFQLMSWMILGGISSRRWRCRLTVAGSRSAQAPSTRARRAWVFPAWVIEPGWRRAPEEYAAGIKPKHFISALGVSHRLRSPIAATLVTAPVHCTPRSAWRASTTGCTRHALT
jgi:hypothetical protein